MCNLGNHYTPSKGKNVRRNYYTSGIGKLCCVITLLVGEKLCRVNNLIINKNNKYLGLATEILTTLS